MTDRELVDRLFAREEAALSEAEARFGAYCRTVAFGVLRDESDAEECVNDTFLRLWNTIPPARPERLLPFVARIARNAAIDRYRAEHAAKRGETVLLTEELAECIPATDADDRILRDALERFLQTLSREAAFYFVRRYWHADTIAEISRAAGVSESRVKTSLFRTRGRLKIALEKEGWTV